MSNRKLTYGDLITLGSIVALVGFIFSGPVSLIVVKALSPQPRWVSSSVFISNYHIIQDVPYYFGFLLIGGMLIVSAGHYLNYQGSDNKLAKFHLFVAFGWTIVFCSLISFNYVCQIAFVRNLAINYKPEYDFAIATFSMANPLSFCWANEMWGYAFLGISTLLMSGYYRSRNRMIRLLLITNGVVSIATAMSTIIDINWVLTPIGLIAYLVWNALMIAVIILIYKNHQPRLEFI